MMMIKLSLSPLKGHNEDAANDLCSVICHVHPMTQLVKGLNYKSQLSNGARWEEDSGAGNGITDQGRDVRVGRPEVADGSMAFSTTQIQTLKFKVKQLLGSNVYSYPRHWGKNSTSHSLKKTTNYLPSSKCCCLSESRLKKTKKPYRQKQ